MYLSSAFPNPQPADNVPPVKSNIQALKGPEKSITRLGQNNVKDEIMWRVPFGTTCVNGGQNIFPFSFPPLQCFGGET